MNSIYEEESLPDFGKLDITKSTIGSYLAKEDLRTHSQATMDRIGKN